MRKLIRVFLAGCFLTGVAGAAIACDAQYDPGSGRAIIPCIGVNEAQAYDVILQDRGGNNFTVIAANEMTVLNPPVTGLRILLTPAPVAVVFGYYPYPCVTAYHRPSFVQTGNHIDIRVKARVSAQPIFACAAVIVPFVEAVSLSGVANPAGLTYSVNGIATVPTF